MLELDVVASAVADGSIVEPPALQRYPDSLSKLKRPEAIVASVKLWTIKDGLVFIDCYAHSHIGGIFSPG